MDATSADWFIAAGTVGTFGVTGFVLFREQRDRFRVNAVRVSAWVEEVTDLRKFNDFGAEIAMQGQSVRITAINQGVEPAYAFQVEVMTSYAPDAGSMVNPPGLLAPGQTTTVWVDGVEFPPSGLAAHPRINFYFRDARGRRWKRLHNGDLSRARKRDRFPDE